MLCVFRCDDGFPTLKQGMVVFHVIWFEPGAIFLVALCLDRGFMRKKDEGKAKLVLM